jgi:hypothetical protein
VEAVHGKKAVRHQSFSQQLHLSTSADVINPLIIGMQGLKILV